MRLPLTIRKQALLLFKLVGLPLSCISVVAFVFLYVMGGFDLLKFAFREICTWRGAWAVVKVVGGLAVFVLIKHSIWYADEPPPMWFRRSVAVNVLEVAVLLLVICIGFLAIVHFGSPALPR